jgi:transcriptional regulator with XRE-family HTH domain
MMTTDLVKNLAKVIRALRGDQTQRAFARKLGIDQAALNRIEQGKENITLKTIQKLCNSLRFSVGEFVQRPITVILGV